MRENKLLLLKAGKRTRLDTENIAPNIDKCSHKTTVNFLCFKAKNEYMQAFMGILMTSHLEQPREDPVSICLFLCMQCYLAKTKYK